ncbi:WD repeat-containing protein-like protein [Polyplosphaeria fusca]|uniref:WD repeat-containing protein-like protein n=1 Tax=Polyplosphaeria fusca TaxID=682080 RepID=A0A9P4QTN9_9PLEO|nr:WD repeat-containing protein-like protein [Polyplosphaeria fusca]
MSSPSPNYEELLQEPISEILSSSPPHPAAHVRSRKPKKPPPITPKRFTRFFTPRSSVHGPSSSSASQGNSGRQLQELTRTALNRRNNARSTPRKTVKFEDAMAGQEVHTPQVQSRKRKLAYPSPESSPAHSSPSKRSRYALAPPISILEDEHPINPTPIRRLKSLGSTSRILQRSFGGSLAVGRGFVQDHCSLWHDQMAEFYSGPDDYHKLQQRGPPLCTASCNTTSLVAVGDESGHIHLLDADTAFDFIDPHISFKAHTNAIMDLDFSSDDSHMASGSGDQTAQILDVRTQQCLHVLAKHKSSVKQVRFQPGDDKIVATSSRDGCVQIWDLRCKGGSNNIHSVWGPDAPYVGSITTMRAAHDDYGSINVGPVNSKPLMDAVGISEAVSRRGEISVTALSFLPNGRQHLLLTASDASTRVKLWDIRARYPRNGPAVPIATTIQPDSHTRHRQWAINSLALSSDASRFYALSKDNTIYAYSTSHLILGVAPELSSSAASTPPKYSPKGRQGLGPMYGFRHAKLHAGTFFVKASLRRASGDRPELLAVGSTTGCPVLFPTDEKFLLGKTQRQEEESDDLPQVLSENGSKPTLSRASSVSSRFPSSLTDTIPIYSHGTPLVEGHAKEVSSVCWAKNGTLVSISDDRRIRRWMEGPQARQLRVGGETEGRRWGCGWAEASKDINEED